MADWITFCLLLLAQIAAAAAMFCYKLPRRPHFLRRLLFSVGFMAAVAIFNGWLQCTIQQIDPHAMPLTTFSLPLIGLLVGTAVVISLCFDITRYTVLFITVAAFSVQCLWSTLRMLVQVVMGELGLVQPHIQAIDLIGLVLMALVYSLCWRRYARHINPQGLQAIQSSSLWGLMGVVAVFEIAFNLLTRNLLLLGHLDFISALLMNLTNILGCLLVLMMEFDLLYRKRLQDQSRLSQELLAAERRQYEISRDNLQELHLKCHDLKHQIRQLTPQATVDPGVLQQLEDIIDVRDAMFSCGCDALDVILTEKALACQRHHIPFTCVADGSSLAFMDDADIYSLFGNAIDNATEAQEEVAPNERAIALQVHRRGNLIGIEVSNACAKDQVDIQVTSKDDTLWHGWGTRSMREIVERYQGIMTTTLEDSVFTLNILIPIPSEHTH